MKRTYSAYQPAKQARTVSAPLSESSGNANVSLQSATRSYKNKGKRVLPKGASKLDKRIVRYAGRVARNVLKSAEEVKYLFSNYYGASVGQTYTTGAGVISSGHWSAALPTPATGSASNQMVGDRCKMKMWQANISFKGQTKTANDKHLKYLLIRVKGPTPAFFISQVLRPNGYIDSANGGDGTGTVIQIYDTTCLRSLEAAGSIDIIHEQDLLVTCTPSGTGTGPKVIKQDFNISVPMYGRVHEISSGTIVNNLYQQVILCDSGERGTTAPLASALQETTDSTGLSFAMNYMLTFTDV